MNISRKISNIHLLLILFILLAGFGLSRITRVFSQTPLKIYFPLVSRTGTVVVPPTDAAAARITVPPGFAIRIFAQNIPGTPRFMAVGPDGWVYISLLNGGQIARLPDRNGDGIADGVEIVANGLNGPHGLEWNSGWLYVAENDRVERLRASSGSPTLDQRELITANLPGGGGHSTRTLHFGPDGLLYISAGSSCNVCAETDPRRAAILRFNPNGTIPPGNPFANDANPQKQPVWAWGLRNSVDFLWTPTGQMWANLNSRDLLGDTIPPEPVVIQVQGGKSHGWPYCYTAGQGLNSPPQAEVLDTQSGLALPPGFDCSLTHVQPALFTIQAHSAPLGMALGAKAAFPAAFQKDLYVALHGSWNTTPASYRDCKVEQIVITGGGPVSAQDFATGWRGPGVSCGDPASYGRPADVIFGPDGVLYISDDAGGRVYRVVYVGH